MVSDASRNSNVSAALEAYPAGSMAGGATDATDSAATFGFLKTTRRYIV
jgi:hypothetical protein